MNKIERKVFSKIEDVTADVVGTRDHIRKNGGDALDCILFGGCIGLAAVAVVTITLAFTWI